MVPRNRKRRVASTPRRCRHDFSDAGGKRGSHHCWPRRRLYGTFGNHVERITTQGVVTSFPTGTGIYGGQVGIVTGPDGALWIAETLNKIARVTTTGDVTQYQHGISAGAGPQEITVGPDGNLWFTESGQTGGKPGIAKMVVKGLTRRTRAERPHPPLRSRPIRDGERDCRQRVSGCGVGARCRARAR